ncbi:hypothetical protein DVDV_4268 [Desulfovibrio sp. DV]|nr:hypothetical protein DVDV_4268 [Desulfovibrio sp. DV]
MTGPARHRLWRVADAALLVATLWALTLAGIEVAADLRMGQAQEAVSRRIPHFPDTAPATGYGDTQGREMAQCLEFVGKKPLVVLVLGQSNVANGALGEYVPKHRLGNFLMAGAMSQKIRCLAHRVSGPAWPWILPMQP